MRTREFNSCKTEGMCGRCGVRHDEVRKAIRKALSAKQGGKEETMSNFDWLDEPLDEIVYNLTEAGYTGYAKRVEILQDKILDVIKAAEAMNVPEEIATPQDGFRILNEKLTRIIAAISALQAAKEEL